MRTAVTALILALMWYVLSGKFDAMHLGLGLVASVALALLTRRWRHARRPPLLRFLAYLPWLAVAVFKSNLHVARLVLNRRMPIRPGFFRLSHAIADPRGQALLGSSITLTPGTVTLEIHDGQVVVHALDEASLADLHGGEMIRRVQHVFDATVAGETR